MPRPSQEAKILDAALACFAEHGYEGTRVRHIAERALVSEGALYRHYTSKEALAQALYAHYFRQFSLVLQQAAMAEQTAEAQVRALLRTIIACYRENPVAVTFVLLRQPTFMPDLPPDAVYPLDVIAQVVTAGQRVGAIRDGQPNLLAAIAMGCVLRPIIVSQLAQPGSLDLLATDVHDQVISDAGWAALARP